MTTHQLPSSYVWRGIELKRVTYRERIGDSIYGTSGYTAEWPSNPPRFLGTVGLWSYVLEAQSDGSWVGKIQIGGAGNIVAQPSVDPLASLDAAAAWWSATVALIPYGRPVPTGDAETNGGDEQGEAEFTQAEVAV